MVFACVMLCVCHGILVGLLDDMPPSPGEGFLWPLPHQWRV